MFNFGCKYVCFSLLELNCLDIMITSGWWKLFFWPVLSAPAAVNVEYLSFMHHLTPQFVKRLKY